MCGIAGFSGRFDPALLERMGRALTHRGPDDSGVWSAPADEVGLAHRRLSIIDLSPSGHQPMWDATASAAIVFNGEIYNYRELRRDLESGGARFNSSSDTEVILNLYLRDGPALLPRLDGIFAFALWDARSRELLLARDGLGVKPLYLAQTPRGLLFASELKALLKSEDLDRELDPVALQQHLGFIWCPAPHTLLRGVRKLEPGGALRVRGGRVLERWSFYDLPYAEPPRERPEREVVERTRELVQAAVARQMVADVPVGALLSGGVDSSAVVVSARNAGYRSLPCFTIAFRDESFAKEGFEDDREYARLVARECGYALHEIEVGPEIAGRLEQMIWHLDEPTADPAALNVLAISELARASDIKVLLSGTGGDDIFGGYRRHRALLAERYWSWAPLPLREIAARAASALPQRTPLARRVRRALQFAASPAEERLLGYFLWAPPATVSALFAPDLRASLRASPLLDPLEATLARLPAGTDPLQRMLYLEGKHFLADHNLNYFDKMSMACGVEIRVPLLDTELVGFAASLPTHFKQRGAVGKWALRRAMEGVLPSAVLRRSKTGFGAPIRRWLGHELRELVADVLSERTLRARGLFDAAGVARMIDQDRAGRIDASFTILGLVCIELWCRAFLRA